MRLLTINVDTAHGDSVRLLVTEENLAVVLDALTGRDNGNTEIRITQPLMVMLEDGTYSPTQ